jgi:hypothetical protein
LDATVSGTRTGTTTIAERAHARFGKLRAEARRAVASGALADRLAGGDEVPAGWCVSTIARVVVNDPDAVPALARAQDAVAATGACTRYAAGSLHVSLLGCTPRQPSPAFAPERVAAIVDAVTAVVAGRRPAPVELGAVNLLGNQWFVEVVPQDDSWSALRRALVAPLEALGERPIAYPDTEPMHLNVARQLTLASPATAERLLAAPPGPPHGVALATIEVVTTDFTVTPATLRTHATLPLAGPGLTGPGGPGAG